jgi:hypothetical protein
MRILDFADGFSSSTEPNQGTILVSGLQSYVDDAAFETAKGSASAAGDSYYNTTFGCFVFHDGTGFLCGDVILKEQTSFTIANNIAVNTDVTGATFDSSDFTSAVIEWEILRSDDVPTENMARGRCSLFYKPTAGWQIETEFEGDDVGVTFSVTDTAGVVQLVYQSSNYTGGTYVGTMKYTIKDQMRA